MSATLEPVALPTSKPAGSPLPVPHSTLDEDRSGSPSRPPVSPITPYATFAQVASTSSVMPPPPPPASQATQSRKSQTQPSSQPARPPSVQQPNGQETPYESPARPSGQPHPPPTFILPPEPVPFDEDENTDVMALRAAIAVLENQKAKTRRDFATLSQLRKGLREDPDRFVEELVSGNLREEQITNDPIAATFSQIEPSDSGDSEEEGELKKKSNNNKVHFPKIPVGQNIARCPPINWAKYHIVGEPLDRMHEEQLKRPTLGTPLTGPLPLAGDPSSVEAMNSSFSAPRAPEAHVFRPYDPVLDDVHVPQRQFDFSYPVDGVQTRRRSKK